MPIVINNYLLYIDFDLGTTMSNMHLISMLANTRAATNTGKITTCYLLLYCYINKLLLLFLHMLYYCVLCLTINALLYIYIYIYILCIQ